MDMKVCIVGAGVAGLKAAHTLLNDPKSKFKKEDVVIVEAQDYIGGRVLTDKTSSKLGYLYDLGAAWFHDSLTNITLAEAIADNNKEEWDFEKDGYYDNKDCVYYHRDVNGKFPINDWKLHRVTEELNKFIEIYYFEGLDKEDMSLLEITELYKSTYKNRLTSEQLKYLTLFIRFYELWYGISSDKISAKYTVMAHEGRDLYNLKGYSYLLEKLLKGFPGQNILLNHPVTKILRNRKDLKQIEVHTPQKTIPCDYLIVTVPLSVLQLPASHPYGITWEPPLPKNITNSLSQIHFGALGKVIFEFDDVWWDRTEERIVVLPDEETKDLSSPLAKQPENLKYPYLVINYEAMHKRNQKGGSFVILTQSPLTDYLEAHPENAWSYFKESFNTFVVPGKTVTEPINVLTSKWTTNPYIRGSYSAYEIGDDPNDIIVQLSGEIEGQGLGNSPVRFAGEHTISEGDGCVHGAFMSGAREAQWIIAHSNSTTAAL